MSEDACEKSTKALIKTMDFGYNLLKQQLMNSVIAKQSSETSRGPAVQVEVDEPKIPAEIKNEENENASEDSDIWRFNIPLRTPSKSVAPILQSSKPAESSFSERFSDFKTNEESPRGSYVFSGLSPVPLSSKQWQNTNCLQGKPLNTPKQLGSEYEFLFPFTSFNTIQSMAFDVLVSSDQSVVVSSPTGSGKTVIFELAIVRVLERLKANRNEFCPKPKIIYMAPVKALCTERFADWNGKFTRLGVKCIELTGDTDGFSAEMLQKIKDNVTTLILTTPEKWDSVTRKWREYRDLVLLVKLFLIDEVHLLNEDQRGPTLEAVVSRMRTVQSCIPAQKAAHWSSTPLRFIAASATIPNPGDVAEWLSSSDHVPAAVFQIGEEGRPVSLTRLVLGFPFQEHSSDFRFDMNLNYKLPPILTTHSNGKPSLVFCSTRRGTQQTAMFLAKNLCPKVTNPQSRKRVEDCANSVLDPSLRENLLCGVGFHHAGLSPQDRRIVEDLFGGGHLPILVSTSTLALGVNLPAHLVVVKSTTQIVSGASGGQGQEYPVAQILQMIGRAGRPQFDTTATAVIMTKSSLKEKYEKILSGAQPIESCLHRYLKEHLNAEIVLRTITDVNLAVTWLQSTYLYVRATKLPKFYGVSLPKNTSLNEEMTKPYVEQYLLDLCMREVNALNKIGLITFNEFNVAPTPAGRLMAQYYIGYNTMALFAKLTGNEDLPDLLQLISSCAEFSDTQLRASERTALNQLNKDRQNVTIRFQLPGRIGTKELKVNCLLQATLGNLNITDSNLSQECPKIIRLANRVAKCMVEYLWSLCDKSNGRPLAKALVNAVVLAKCFSCKLWENSPYVAKQIEKIGPTLSKNLAESGYTTFKKIANANPRDLERVYQFR